MQSPRTLFVLAAACAVAGTASAQDGVLGGVVGGETGGIIDLSSAHSRGTLRLPMGIQSAVKRDGSDMHIDLRDDPAMPVTETARAFPLHWVAAAFAHPETGEDVRLGGPVADAIPEDASWTHTVSRPDGKVLRAELPMPQPPAMAHDSGAPAIEPFEPIDAADRRVFQARANCLEYVVTKDGEAPAGYVAEWNRYDSTGIRPVRIDRDGYLSSWTFGPDSMRLTNWRDEVIEEAERHPDGRWVGTRRRKPRTVVTTTTDGRLERLERTTESYVSVTETRWDDEAWVGSTRIDTYSDGIVGHHKVTTREWTHRADGSPLRERRVETQPEETATVDVYLYPSGRPAWTVVQASGWLGLVYHRWVCPQPADSVE